MSWERPSRNAGKRTYVDESDVGSDKPDSGSEEEEVQTSRRTKRQRPAQKNCVTPTNEGINDEDYESDDPVSGKKNTPYEAGQILRVEVENFMCHRKFTLDLGRNLNFITGRNGSGKSAIAAAIQLCLGSSARHTGRGSNIGKYIREGSEDPAVLMVRLLNQGQDAYKPDLYGNRITVKRVISKNSGSTYHLLDQHGKEVTRLKSELENMLKAFNIYVDTPCCILTQEESKRLIHGSAKEKYAFFLRATGLQSVYDDLARGEKDLEEATQMRDQELPRLTQRKADYEAAKARVEEFKQLDGIEDKIRHNTALLLWDDVRSEEAVLEGLHQRALEFEEAADAAQAELAADTGEDTSAQKIAAATEELNLVDADHQQQKEAVEAKQAEWVVLQRALGKMQTNMREHERGVKDHEARIRANENEIRTLQDKARSGAQTEERVFIDRIDAIDAEVVQMKQKTVDLEAQRKDVQAEVSKLQTEHNRVSSHALFLDRKVGTTKRELAEIESGGNKGKAAQIGPSVPELLRKIQQNAQRFSEPVIGPIGMCVSIREGCEKWSLALESSLNTMLRAFVVTTSQDRNTLFKMMCELNCQNYHPIITQYPGPRFHTNADNVPGAVIMSEALVCDDLVFNCLVDQLNMDHVAFIDSEDQVLSQFREHVQGYDHLKYGLARVVTANATCITYKQGCQSSEMARNVRNVLSSDTAAYAATLRQDLQAMEQEQEENRAAQYDLSGRTTAGNAELRGLSTELERLQGALKKAARARQELEGRLSELQESAHIDTTPYEVENATLQGNLETIHFQKEQLQAEIDAQNAKLKATAAEKKAAEKIADDLGKRVDQQEKSLEKLISKQADANKRRAQLEKEVVSKRNTLANFMVTVQKQIAVRDEKVAHAKTHTANLVEGWNGEPLPLGSKDNKAAIDRRIRGLRVDLEEGKKKVNLEGYTMPILTDRMAAAKEAYSSSKLEFQNLTRRLKEAEDVVEKSKKKWERSYKQIVKETRTAFDFYAQKQGAAGTVKFDNDNEEMSLIVQMDSHDIKTQATDVKNLSGGERSYVTLCLLLALGHVTESPFRLMDEYDVYMDEGRRNDTLNSIQLHARDKGQRNRQIIVVTPHSLASVKHSDFVRIVKMPDPVKRSAHGLQQQTLD